MNLLKKRLLRCAIFVALLFFADRGLHLFFSRSFAGLETVGLDEMIRSDAEIVILGSSRACHHYNSEVLDESTGESVFNAGRDGLGIPYMRGVCDILLNKCSAKLIVIEVGPSSILAKYCRGQLKRAAYLAPYIDDSEVVKEMIYQQGYQQRIKYMSKAYRYNGQPMYLLYDLVKRDRFVKGFEPLDKFYTPEVLGDFDSSGSADEAAVEFDEQCVSWLRDMVRAAKDKGVGVLLVTSPRWSGIAGYDPEGQATFSFIRKLAEEETVPYVVVNEDDYPVFRDSSLFADAGHLNREGARVFSEVFASILIEKNYLAEEGANRR